MPPLLGMGEDFVGFLDAFEECVVVCVLVHAGKKGGGGVVVSGLGSLLVGVVLQNLLAI